MNVSKTFVFPLAASDIIPQQPPMRLLHSIVSCEGGVVRGLAVVDVDSPFILPSGKMLPSVYVEMAAQCLAAGQALKAGAANTDTAYDAGADSVPAPVPGYLVGVKNLVLHEAAQNARAGVDCEIQSSGDEIMMGFAVADAKVFQQGQLLAELELKAWLPKD